MNRRSFLLQTTFGGAALFRSKEAPRTKHLILIVSGGARKKDYYENEMLCPNIRKLASEGFVFEEDHCERVSSHDAAFMEMLTGRADGRTRPNLFDYLNVEFRVVPSLGLVPEIMQTHKPRILVCRETGHDLGHESYEEYLRVVRGTDSAVSNLVQWLKNHRDFSDNTAVVFRPEFGRDDEVNRNGQLHHSEGFYYTHRVASIFWGPDFKRGVDRTTVISRLDLAPTLTTIFGLHKFNTEHSPSLPIVLE